MNMTHDVGKILRTISTLTAFSKEMKEQEDSSAQSSAGAGTSSVKSWESGRKMGKTYGGPKYVWNSDRVMGKTYSGNPKSKWESGASRGKANPLT